MTATATIISRWQDFLGEIHKQMIQLEQSWPDEAVLQISWMDLQDFDQDFAIQIRGDPVGYLGAANKILLDRISKAAPDVETERVPVITIDAFPEHERIGIGDIRPRHLGKLVCFEGIIKKSSEILPRVTRAVFQCRA